MFFFLILSLVQLQFYAGRTICFPVVASTSAAPGKPVSDQGACRDGVRIMWYNVENLFHPSDDSCSSDDAFTAEGLYHWTYGRYRAKITRIAKVIIAAGEGEPPEIVGLGEIECDSVLEDLVSHPILESYGYRYLHHDSPDHRGIDVACLYREKRVTLLGWNSCLPPPGRSTREAETREMLHGCWLLNKKDTLDLLLVHLISRYGGSGATVDYRRVQSRQIISIMDSIGRIRPGSMKIVAGDFNDEFSGPSMQAFREDSSHGRGFYTPVMPGNPGSYKYHGKWELIDYFLVCGQAHEHEISARIFTLPPLMTRDETYGGNKPFRTFEGMRFIGGTSDHLPVLLIIK